MTMVSDVPLEVMLQHVVEHPDALRNRRGERFAGYAVVLDDGHRAGGPLDQVLTALPTLHSVTPTDLLLLLPGTWQDRDRGDRLATWTSVGDQLPDDVADASEGVSGPGAAGGAGGALLPDYGQRTAGLLAFTRGGDQARGDLTFFGVVGVNDLLDWLGLSAAVLPGVLLLSVAERRAVLVDGGDEMPVVTFFRNVRSTMEREFPASPCAAAMAVCDEFGLSEAAPRGGLAPPRLADWPLVERRVAIPSAPWSAGHVI